MTSGFEQALIRFMQKIFTGYYQTTGQGFDSICELSEIENRELINYEKCPTFFESKFLDSVSTYALVKKSTDETQYGYYYVIKNSKFLFKNQQGVSLYAFDNNTLEEVTNHIIKGCVAFIYDPNNPDTIPII